MCNQSPMNAFAAVVPEKKISLVLTAVHRSGLGHRARVIRARDDTLTHRLFGRQLGHSECLLVVQTGASSPKMTVICAEHGLLESVQFEETESASTLLSIDPKRFRKRRRRPEASVPTAD